MADWLIIYNYNIYIYTLTCMHAYVHTDGKTDRKTQTERQRQTDRQTDGQTDRHTYWVNYNDITATEPWNHGW